MQIEELYDLTTWIQDQIVKNDVLQKYKQLHAILHKNSQGNQPLQPFESQRENLISTLSLIDLNSLSAGQIEILNSIGIGYNVGAHGVVLVTETLQKNILDIASAASRLQESTNEIANGIQWSEQVRNSLSAIIKEDSLKEIGDKVLLRVHFTKEAHLSNLTEFKYWGKAWWEIGRGISMAHGQSPESIEVIGASKGSLIITLLSAYGIARTTSAIIMEALKVVEKVCLIRKNLEEVRALKLQNNEAEKALAKAAKDEQEKGLEGIIARMVEEIGLDPTTEGDKVNQLSSSIKKLVEFIDKGGEVDFVIPNEDGEDAEESPQKQNLRVMFSEVRRLERKVQQLELQDPN